MFFSSLWQKSPRARTQAKPAAPPPQQIQRFAKLALALAVGLAGCSRQAATGPARIAVLRFENLTADVTLDWMGRAASEIISHEIKVAPITVLSSGALHATPLAQSRPVSAPGVSAEMAAAIGEGATSVVMGQISMVRGRLTLDITERDTASGKTVKAFNLSSSGSGDVYALADAAARQLSPQVTPFDSKNNQAIADWARATEEADYAKATTEYASAVHADPAFAPAWLDWAASAAAHGDRAAAGNVLGEAQQHGSQFSELNRARLKLAAVRLTGDRAATLAAMNELGRLLPDDAGNIAALAEQNFVARQYPAAVAGYRRLTELSPKNPQAWNQLGYSLMYSGDYGGAISAMQSYQRLAPNEVNPLDSQGDVAFAFGRFDEAEKLYDQAAAKDPSFQNSIDLYKAAGAHLMTGDVAGADKKFEAYAAARRTAKDASLPFRTAQWRFFSGRRAEAMSSLANLLTGTDAGSRAPQFRALVLTQMAIWDLQLGHRDRALQESGDALKTGAGSAVGLIARFASEDARTGVDWVKAADRLLGTPQLAQLKPLALAYALYFSHNWEPAGYLWKQLLDRATPDDSGAQLIYAQILVELKRPKEAEPLVKLFPILHPDAGQEFFSLTFPAIFEIRAAAQASQGQNAEAEASRKVYRALWGN